MKKKIIGISGLSILLIIFVVSFLFIRSEKAAAPTIKANSAADPTKVNTAKDTETKPSFNKTTFSNTDPNSLWVVVNKKSGLPSGYTPEDLKVPDVTLRLAATEEQMQVSGRTENDLETMFTAAGKDGIKLMFGSGYRSEKLQKTFYDKYVSESGQTPADKFSARPGHSEHQTGLAFDIGDTSKKCYLETCFADTAAGKWVAENSYIYGFTIRYKNGKDQVTGYQYEPWHLRYVGVELAAELNKTNQTLEEFFDLTGTNQY